MRDLREINMNEGGEPVTRAPPTDVQIAEFQSHFGIVLPKDYLLFLRHSNGGHPKLNAFRAKDQIEEFFWGLNRFYHFGVDHQDEEGLWRETEVWQSVLGGKLVPIADTGGGDQILLSFDKEPPGIKLCLHDEGMELIDVADSFSEFIDMLTEDPDMI